MAFPQPYGRYVLEERIAMGGMAEIFRARTTTAGFVKQVCIKRILPHYVEQADFVAMFRDEAALAARLQHVNVVQVFDFGTVDDTLFLAMELVDGADLRRLLDLCKRQGKRLGVGHALEIAIEMCRGLYHAHTLVGDDGQPLGLIHRDISPHNVLISRSGDVKVTDFGIAKASARATHTGAGVVKGKLAYMAPEQAQSQPLDQRVDQFATGIVLWEMLTGEKLFSGNDEVSILKKVMLCEVRPPAELRAELPPVVDGIVTKALAAEPRARFADMRELEHALTRALFEVTSDPEESNLRALVDDLFGDAEQSKKRSTAVLADAPAISAPPDDEDVPSLTEAGFSQVFSSSGEGEGPNTSIASALGADSADSGAATVISTSPRAASPTSAPAPSDDTGVTRTIVPGGAPLPSTTESHPPVDAASSSEAEGSRTEPAPVPPLGAARNNRVLLVAAPVVVVLLLAIGGAALLGGGGDDDATPADDVVVSVAAAPAVALPPPPSHSPPAPREETPPPSPVVEEAAPAPAPPPLSPAPREQKERAPRAKGKLLIEMASGWANAYLGKTRLCETPCTVELPAGRHTLRLVGPGGSEKKHKVVVKAGATVRALVP